MLFTEVFHIRSALKVTTTLPMPWSIAKNVLRGLLLREVYCSIQILLTNTHRKRLSNTTFIDFSYTETRMS